MKSCKKQTNKSRWRTRHDVDIIAQGFLKFPFQMDTVITRVPFVHAIFVIVAHRRRRSRTIPSVSTKRVNRRAHVIENVTVTFRYLCDLNMARNHYHSGLINLFHVAFDGKKERKLFKRSEKMFLC